MSGRSEYYCCILVLVVLLHDCHALLCSLQVFPIDTWLPSCRLPHTIPTVSALIVYSHGEVDGWGVSAWWPIHRGAQIETLRCDNCSNAPSCCYARANYLRLTITAAENLICAGFQCQDTYSYGILVPNCLTPDYEIYIQYRMFPPPPSLLEQNG